KPLTRVFMLIKRRAVEPRQPVRISGEMRGHPVEDHPDPRPMRPINKPREPLGRAEPGAWRIEAGGLVAPARVVGMLGYRQEFDMGKAHLDDMGDQRIRHLVPAEKPATGM